MKSTGGKAAAEMLLTHEQRQQLLEACQQVGAQLPSSLFGTSSVCDTIKNQHQAA
jgi:uncharacterized protein YoaH (UPF0181 family)